MLFGIGLQEAKLNSEKSPTTETECSESESPASSLPLTKKQHEEYKKKANELKVY